MSETAILEGMTSISAVIKAHELCPASARPIERVVYDASLAHDKFRQIGFLKAKSAELGFELYAVPASEIDAVTSGNTHGGFAAFCGERVFPDLFTTKLPEKGVYYLLDGIEDPYNFGYTLRSLYAAGADGVVLPERNWFSAAGTVARSSAGCSELLEIFVLDTVKAVKYFKSAGYRVISANIRDSELIYDADLSAPVLFIIGGEKRGVSRSLLELTDVNIRIGYARDFSGSLPTAEAAAIIAFEAAKSNKLIK